MTENLESLIDRIYEAAVLPDLWADVLDRLAQWVEAEAGAVMAIRRADDWTGWVMSPESEGWVQHYLSTNLAARTEVTHRLIAANYAGFITENDLFSAEVMDRDPFFTELLRPFGLGSATATAIPIPTGDMIVFHAQRKRGQNRFEREELDVLDSLRPHLARASLLSTRLRMEQLQAAAEALAIIGLPAAILGLGGRVLSANRLMEGQRHHIFWVPGDRLAMADVKAQGLYEQGVAHLNTTSLAPIRSFPIYGASNSGTVVGHLIPTPRQARMLFDGALGIFVLTPISGPKAPEADLIQALFDLTPAEARIDRGITAGGQVNQLAERFGVSVETVRGQVKGVLAKVGASSQAELVGRLSGIGTLKL